MENKKEMAQHKMNNDDKPEWLKQAAQYEQASDLKAAEDIYKAQLAKNPNDDDALCGMAGIACKVKNFDAAVMFANNAVKANPKNVAAITYMGVSLSATGHFKQAEACFNQAIEIDASYPMPYYHLASIQYEQHKNNNEAIKLLEKALELSDNIPLAWNLLGVIYAEEGWHLDALDCYEKVIESGFADDLVYYNKGNLLLERRFYMQALDCFDKALLINPNQVVYLEKKVTCLYERGSVEEVLPYLEKMASFKDVNKSVLYKNLASYWMSMNNQVKLDEYLQKMKELNPNNPLYYAFYFSTRKLEDADKNLIQKMEKLLKDSNLDVDGKISLNFTLASIYEKLKLYDKAFIHWKKGNALVFKNRMTKTTGLYDFNKKIKDKTNVELAQDWSDKNFTKDFFNKRRDYGYRGDEEPIFIVGMPRSGTTLTEQIVSSHSKVVGCGELHSVNYMAVHKLTAQARINPLENANSILGGHRYPVSLLKVDKQRIDECAQYYLNDIKEVFGESGHYTDKMPTNFMHLQFIALMFPKAKVIHCCRHPLDISISIFSQNFSTPHPYMCNLKNLASFFKVYVRQMKLMKENLPLDIHDISYEQLLDSPEEKVKGLINFLGLDWEDNCMNFYKNKKHVVTASYAQVRQPLYQTSRQRWKNYESHIKPLINDLSDIIEEYEEKWMGK